MSSSYFWSESNANRLALGQYLTRREWQFIAQAFARYGAPPTVLDVGGGDGRFALRMAELGSQVTVLERFEPPLRGLRQRAPHCPVVQADGSDLPFAPGTFDAVTAIQVVGYLNLDGFFDAARRVIKPGGLLVMTSRNPLRVVEWARRVRADRAAQPARYAAALPLAAWKTRLRRSGFRCLEARGYRWIPAGRKSNSRLVPLWERLECALGLERLPGLSPWVFCVFQAAAGV